jgi:hypothetical protein
MKRAFVAVVGAFALATSLGGAQAGAPIDAVSSAAAVQTQAQWVYTSTDVVSIYNRANALSPDVAARAISAVEAAHGAWAMGRGVSVGMHAVRRNGAIVQQAPDGFAYPMSTTALPLDAVGPLMGRDVAGVLARGFVVMGRSTAQMRGAAVGDVVDLVSASGALASFLIGMVADDAIVGGTELLITPAQADVIGAVVESRIVLWGFDSRAVLDQGFTRLGLDVRPEVRIRRSWDAFDPDSTIGMVQTKALLGEFAYQVRPNGVDLDVTGDWESAFMPPAREVLVEAIPIRARCNNTIRADLQAALTEVDAAGLGGAIEVANANAYGGCYYPRFNRLSGELGFLSRHSWGMALDTNTVSNAQGHVPQMNCDVVRIFRKHNFAWGGNFLTPDGMHFEWVGTRRDQYLYPSRYCPNLAAVITTENAPSTRPGDGAAVPAGRATLFADDGFANGE